NGEAIPCERVTVDIDGEILPACYRVNVQVFYTGYTCEGSLYPLRHGRDTIEILSVNFHADIGTDTGREHVDAINDRLCPTVDDTGNLHFCIELVDDVVFRDAFTPLCFWF